MEKIVVAVFFGGRSNEHEVSLKSAVYVLQNFPEQYIIIPVGISKSGAWYHLRGTYSAKDFRTVTDQDLASLASGYPTKYFEGRTIQKAAMLPYPKEVVNKISFEQISVLNTLADVFFPVLHGSNGEDGRLQGLFELCEVVFVGSTLKLSALTIDKDLQKQIVRAKGIRVAKYLSILRGKWNTDKDTVIESVEKRFGYPCFVKPNSLGSSVGTGRVHSREQLVKAIDYGFNFDIKVLVEENLVGTEVECSFLGDAVSPRVTMAGEIVSSDYYSHQEKYSKNSKVKIHIPARLNSEKADEYKAFALGVADCLELVGPARIDSFYLKDSGAFVFNEVNSLPGLTSLSLFPQLLLQEGTTAEEWIKELIDDALARRSMVEKLQLSYM